MNKKDLKILAKVQSLAGFSHSTPAKLFASQVSNFNDEWSTRFAHLQVRWESYNSFTQFYVQEVAWADKALFSFHNTLYHRCLADSSLNIIHQIYQ